MKKILLSFSLLTGIFVNAQLPDGSIAPDFTLSDINGVEHNLYDYLDQGKTVFIDFSGTWCVPCWGFHETGALDQLWENHGPLGADGVSGSTTDDVIVLFIEADGNTTDDDLHGTGGNTQGDWVTGVHHPIIDPAAGIINPINAAYEIGSFPTIYKVCPNRIITNVGALSSAGLYASVGDCLAPASNPADVALSLYTGDPTVCGPAFYTPKIRIQNNGTTPLTEATITIKVGENTVSTGNFVGNLGTYDFATVVCSAISDYLGGELEITVTTNGDADETNGSLNYTVLSSIEISNRILVSITTDQFANEIEWKIKTPAGATVSGTKNPTLTNNTSYDFVYNLANLGCYIFSITDEYGDGIIQPGSINVRDYDGTNILNYTTYGSGIDIPIKIVEILNTASVEENSTNEINIYPNPSNGQIKIKSDFLTQYTTIELIDQLGRMLSFWQINSTTMNIDLNEIANGNYILVFKGDNKRVMQKIQLDK